MDHKIVCLAALVLLAGSCHAGCPFAGRKGQPGTPNIPAIHPTITPAAATSSGAASRKLTAQATLDPTYLTAFQALIADLSGVIGKCQFSLEGMKYANNDATVLVNSSSVFFPAGSWLRAFFHDAGTYIKKTGKGGPNGSLGVGCPTSTCGNLTSAYPVDPTANVTCPNGDAPVSGFTSNLTYCCSRADECLAHGQSNNTGKTPGQTVPVCLKGSQATVELCRRENDNLLPTIQFLRGRQTNPTFQWGSPLKPLSFADILVAGAAVAVQQCSGQALNITHTFGRIEASVADDTMLPTPTSIIEDKHFAVFQQMGLNKIDMVTLVTGSHTLGGFRSLSSPGLTSAPYVPFDCTPAGQIAQPPFDNNVFKVACDGVQGVTKGDCAWNLKCSNPTVDETPNCPFTGNARTAYAASNPSSYPTPGLVSDIYMCNQPSTKGHMVTMANDQDFFFRTYMATFANLASLGYQSKSLVPQNW